METTVFLSNRSQAVAFPDDVKRVEVTAVISPQYPGPDIGGRSKRQKSQKMRGTKTGRLHRPQEKKGLMKVSDCPCVVPGCIRRIGYHCLVRPAAY